MPNPENVIGKGKPFKKGHDERRNLDGRPPVMPNLEAALARKLSEEKNGKVALERMLESLYNEACAGNIQAVRVILERGYGMVTQKIDTNLNVNSIEVGYGKPDAENNV